MKAGFFGTALVDIVLREPSEKLEHESLYAARYHQIFPGGKALNQAVCAARFGLRPYLLAKVGNDEFGNLIRVELEKNNVSTDFLLIDEALKTGFVVLAPQKEDYKSLLVSYSASLKLNSYGLEKLLPEFLKADFIVGGLELNLNLVKKILYEAKIRGKTTAIDPYPPEKADVEILTLADIITPNQDEGAIISGRDIKSIFAAKMAVAEMQKMGIKKVCLKLGPDGIVIGSEYVIEHLPAVKVQAVDTTGGGDVFAGVLTALLAHGFDFKEACMIANYASALSVTRLGAFASLPQPRELLEFMLHRGADQKLIEKMVALAGRLEK
jgi:ribokinase